MQRKLLIIVFPVAVCTEMLAWKVYIHRSECDLPPMVWIHLNEHSKFGVALLFASGVTSFKLASQPVIIIKLSNATPCCFSEAICIEILGNFSTAKLILSVVAASGIHSGVLLNVDHTPFSQLRWGFC